MVAISTALEPIQKEEYVAFRDFDTPTLHKKFGLKRTKESILLDKWLNTPVKMSNNTATQLEELRERIDFYGTYYNEAELKWNFLTPLIELVNYRTDKYHVFNERILTAEVDGIKIRGAVDLIIATGNFAPEAPYFFIHEYKKEKGTPNDIIAQLLSAMLVAQRLNDNDKPMYGCYLLGRYWHFVVLNQKEYTISHGHIASAKPGISEIYTALVNMKTIIETELI